MKFMSHGLWQWVLSVRSCITNLNDLIKSLNEIKRDKLKENADRVSRVLTGLMRPSPDSYSSKTLSDIASGGVEYVSLLEFYSVTYYRALTVLGSIKNTSEHIRKTFGK
jgi:hypothetical protein